MSTASHTTRNINEVFGEGEANERIVRRRLENFQSGDVTLEIRPCGRPENRSGSGHISN